MKNFIDRVPTAPNRRKITFESNPVNGVNYATIEFADSPQAGKEGTPLNRSAFLALQGFQAITSTFTGNTATETNADGDTLVSTFNPDGSITSVYTAGSVVLTRTTTFHLDGSITEVIS